VGLATAAATRSTAVRGAVTVLLGATRKLAREATRIGAQGNAVVTFAAAGYDQLLSLLVLDLEVSRLQRELGRSVVAGVRGRMRGACGLPS
jgi:hypothetical protein